MRVKRRRKWAVALCAAGLAVLALLALLPLLPPGLLPEGSRFGVYPATRDAKAVGLHPLSAIVVDWEALPQPGQVGAARDPEGVRLSRESGSGLGRYQLFLLGGLLDGLRRYAPVVWAVAGAAYLAALAWAVTYPARGRKRRRDELLRLFQQYGQQFEREEEGQEY